MKKALAAKLKIKPVHTVLVLAGPPGFTKASKQIDLTPAPKKKYDVVILFVENKAALDKAVSKAFSALQADGLMWIAYPKKSANVKTDITRDQGWEAVTTLGFEGVAIVSIDEKWTAFRFSKAKVFAPKPVKIETEKPQVFTAILESASDSMDAAYVSIPFDVEEVYGTRGHIKVKALFDGCPYRGILSNMGTGSHIIIVTKEIRATIGKKIGDKIKVQLVRDTEERIVEVPAELQAALNKNTKAKTFFDSLSFTNRKEYAAWIRDAKKEETKTKRLADAITKMLAGKKNPSEK
jgi:hypothetical protein